MIDEHMTQRPEPEQTLTQTFPLASRALTSGVAVVCTVVDGNAYGTTVATVTPVSDEPPIILVCMNESSSTLQAVLRSGTFTINVLSEDQSWLARQFGSRGDKFADVVHRPCDWTGAPIIEGALATFACRLRDSHTMGTHTVLYGGGLAASVRDAAPLTYFNGSFGRWGRLREHHTYEQVRRLVLERHVRVGQRLDADELAQRVDARIEDVHNALVKLSTESLVVRGADGFFEPAAIDATLIASIYEARANIEIGVVANHVGRVPASVLRRLETIVERMEELSRDPGSDRSQFLALHTDLHTTLVNLSGSSQLVDSYRRLSIAWAWRSIWDRVDWRTFPGRDALCRLLTALRSGDLTEAISSIKEYHEAAGELARTAVGRSGSF